MEITFLVIVVVLIIALGVWAWNSEKKAEKMWEAKRVGNKPPPDLPDYKKLSAAELLLLAKEGDPNAQFF